ncbi:kinase-like domain-containing protein [Achaetomium macrosporum]|uniref:Kinase-like domain-containing protein n=1 Tax=Achaetomium macrosporum TaxID=79813 RepID=A0AAN7C690_9PEZI|nr:kinase-like domain-containing protein [Achaetomium macrosporum]
MVSFMFPKMGSGFCAILGMGGSCFVSYVDEYTVHKSYEIWVNGRRRSYYPESCEEDLAREYAIYKQLGKHDRILRCFGLDEIRPPGVHALRLELAPLGTVRDLIQQKLPGDPLPEQTRLQMCRDVTEGLAYIHSRCVWHSDVSCRNLMHFHGYRGRESSFPVTVAEEAQYEPPYRGRGQHERPTIKRELFALGSCMYEIMAWMRPFQGLRDSEVTKRYERGEFPSLDGIPATVIAQAIWNCRHEVYESADEVPRSRSGNEQLKNGPEMRSLEPNIPYLRTLPALARNIRAHG